MGRAARIRWDRLGRIALLLVLLGVIALYVNPLRSYVSTWQEAKHRRGVTAAPGLYFLGLPWQHTRGSALLGWVGDDAAYVAEQIARRPARQPRALATSGPR